MRGGLGTGIMPVIMPTAAQLVVPPPTVADPAAVARTLGAARRRLGTQRLFEWGTQAAHLALTGLGIVVAGRLLLGRTPPASLLTAWDAAWAGAAGMAFVAQRVWGRWPTVPETARILDRRAATRERFTTALGLGGQAKLAPVESLAAAECARFAGSFPVRRWTPLTIPRAARWLPVPLVTLSLLLGRASLPGGAGGTDPALQAVLRAQADELQRAADTVADRKDDADRRLAEELARAAERLRQAATARNPDDPEAARRDALRELSDLQDRLRRLAAGSGPSPAELAALAAALQRDGSEAARAAAEALRRGDHGEAARQLEKLLAELKQNADPAGALERLARAMQDQAGRLSEAERGELGRQMARAQADAQQREELMKRIADLLRQRAAAGTPGQSAANRGGGQGTGGAGEGAGSPNGTLSNQQLQSLLNSLEDMKNGLNGNNGPGRGGMSLSLQEAPPPGAVQTSPPGGGNSPAGGAPGSERDPGTSELGNRPAAGSPAPPERVARATGMLGEGETLSDFAPSTDPAAPARAGRRYREIYDAMAPAARDSVRQENIPLGSRVLVERYFQNIRPPE